jgi:hypothetical protein
MGKYSTFVAVLVEFKVKRLDTETKTPLFEHDTNCKEKTLTLQKICICSPYTTICKLRQNHRFIYFLPSPKRV